MKKVSADSQHSEDVHLHYGKIRTGLYHYITPPMVISVCLMAVLVTLGFDKISAYFMHSPYLNGMMLVVIGSGLIMAFHNNFEIYRVACLLKQIEAIRARGRTTHEEIHELRQAVEGKAHLLSMATFSAAIDKLRITPALNISDADARLIKSKFGARVSHMRGKVNYLCGILVMLGLIGTFWGLLGTITSVGQAMTKISESFAAQSAAGAGQPNVDMGGFLQSISKPLEGMGVGFSASLFGLTGSLFLGFFNFLAGHAQNRFIEHFSRWIDDCIPHISPSLLDKVKDAKVPGMDELKSWLAGFIYLSNKTNQQIAELVTALALANQTAISSLAHTERLYGNQQKVLQAIESGNRRLKTVQTALGALGNEFKTLSISMRRLPDGLSQVVDQISGTARLQQRTSDAQIEHFTQISDRIEGYSATLAKAAETQALLLRDTQAPQTPIFGEATPEVAELTASVNALLREMMHKNDEALLSVFLRDGATPETPDRIGTIFTNPN